MGGGVVDGEVATDDEHGLGFYRDRIGFTVVAGRTRERDDEDNHCKAAGSDGEESAEHGGEDGLDEIFHGRGKGWVSLK